MSTFSEEFYCLDSTPAVPLAPGWTGAPANGAPSGGASETLADRRVACGDRPRAPRTPKPRGAPSCYPRVLGAVQSIIERAADGRKRLVVLSVSKVRSHVRTKRDSGKADLKCERTIRTHLDRALTHLAPDLSAKGRLIIRSAGCAVRIRLAAPPTIPHQKPQPKSGKWARKFTRPRSKATVGTPATNRGYRVASLCEADRTPNTQSLRVICWRSRALRRERANVSGSNCSWPAM